jgi:hypothetical protein
MRAKDSLLIYLKLTSDFSGTPVMMLTRATGEEHLEVLHHPVHSVKTPPFFRDSRMLSAYPEST